MPIVDAADVLARDDSRAFAIGVLERLVPLALSEASVTTSRGAPDAHLFAYSARRLQSQSLFSAARVWMKKLLDSRSSEYGLCGFPRIGSPDKKTNERPLECDAGLLKGASGVGLVLMDALADEEPGWNRFLGM